MPVKSRKITSMPVSISFERCIKLASCETLELNLRFLQQNNLEQNNEYINKVSVRIAELKNPDIEKERREELSKIRDNLSQSQKDVHFRAVNREKTGAGKKIIQGREMGESLKVNIHSDGEYRYENIDQLSHLVRFVNDEKQEVLIDKIMLLQNPGYKEFISNPVNGGLLDAIKTDDFQKFDENLAKISSQDLELLFAIPQYPSLEMQRKIYDSRAQIQAKIYTNRIPEIPDGYHDIVSLPVGKLRGADAFPEGGIEALLPYRQPTIELPKNPHGNLRGFENLKLPNNQVGGWTRNVSPATEMGGLALVGMTAGYLVKKILRTGNKTASKGKSK